MKNVFYPLAAAFLLLTSAIYSVNVQEYKIGEGYKIQFKSKDPTGTFNVKGTVKFDDQDLSASSFNLSFPVSSINTGNTMKNKKAQTAEWFDAAKHPDIKFVSTKIEQSGANYTVTGNLTIKGVTKEKKVPLTLSRGTNGYVFTGNFSVNRMDFKVGGLSDAVPNTMNIAYTLPVVKK
jgi:polyisoprenoid-binding protein YceI